MANPAREALLRRKQVEARVGLTRSTIYALMSEAKFPKPVPLVGRTVAWKQSDIDKWIAERAKAEVAIALEPRKSTTSNAA